MKTMLFSILPLLILAGATVIILIILAIKRNHILINILTSITLVVSILSAFKVPMISESLLFSMNGFSMFVLVLLLFTGLLITFFSYSYLEKHETNKEEFYILILTGTLGACSLIISDHFVSFFISLELLSVSLFVMIGYLQEIKNTTEAAIKYLILAGVSSSFLLFGMALVFSKTGSISFPEIAQKLTSFKELDFILLSGLGFIIVGVGFKMGVVPFHLWTPDVYEGAPAITTAFIASISKGAIIAVWVQFFTKINGYHFQSIITIFSAIAILSILTGNLLALMQHNLKRLLAYSSIAHMGYILIAFIAGGDHGIEAVAFYLAAYLITVVGAFGIVALFSSRERDALLISDFQGLFWKKPWLAAIFTVILLSLAGLPLTAGFIGKFYVAWAGIMSGYLVPVVVMVIGSVIGLYYYLRIIVEMTKKTEEEVTPIIKSNTSLMVNGIILSILFFMILWIGIFPSQIALLIRFLVSAH